MENNRIAVCDLKWHRRSKVACVENCNWSLLGWLLLICCPLLDYKIHRSFSRKSWTPGIFGMWKRKIGKEIWGRCVSSGSTGQGRSVMNLYTILHHIIIKLLQREGGGVTSVHTILHHPWKKLYSGRVIMSETKKLYV